MTGIYKIVDSVNGLLWGKNILVFMLIGAAIYFSFKTKFMQFRLFNKIVKVLFKNEKGKHGISSLETFFLGTACRVGAGNIAGVVAAISVGGSGSIFWMWIVAMLGSATAFIESSLAVIYRKKEKDGSYTGGTPFIIEKRLNMRWLGIIYALASVVCYFGVTQVMSNSITGSITSVYIWGANNKFFNLQNISSIAVAILVAYIIFFSKSKKDSIIASLNKIVPFMAIIYVVAVIYILVTNLTSIPAMIGNIFSQAFGTKEVLGGTFGAVVMNGVRRGLFSNEAGMGSTPHAHATADVAHPALQGMAAFIGVFIDTILVCTATALIILATDANTLGLQGAAITQQAFTIAFGEVGTIILATCLTFFAFTTIIGWYYFGESNIRFLFKGKFLNVYRSLVLLAILLGTLGKVNLVWALSDMFNGFMVIPNLIALFLLRKEIKLVYTDYLNKVKSGQIISYDYEIHEYHKK